MIKGFGSGPTPGWSKEDNKQQLNAQTAKIRLINGKNAGAEYSLSALKTSIGRNDPPGIMVDIDLTPHESGETPVVSRHHAEFTWSGNTLLLTDLGSTNGTSVNGAPLQGEAHRQPSAPLELKAGDRIVFANLEFEVIVG